VARRNPDPILWLVPLGLLAGWWLLRRRPGAGAEAFGPGAGPPPPPTASEREAMERAYRFRRIGAGRCFDYKLRKVVDDSFCT
jgi:hypothetical protein